MKYRVITAAYDVTHNPPAQVKLKFEDRLTDFLREEIIDTKENVLFSKCENVHDIEDVVLSFWNRLNDSSKEAPDFTHNPTQKVVVIHVHPLEESQ